jgi:cation-transporting ATPase E
MTASLIVVALAAWARPGPSKEPLYQSIIRFVLPASLTISLGAYGVYLLAGILYQKYHFAPDVLLNMEQTALTIFSVITGLLLVPFVVPPIKALAIAREYSGDWRPTLLAAGLFLVFVVIMVVPDFRSFFSLGNLEWWMYLWIIGVAVIWLFVTMGLWYFRAFERFLQLDWRQMGKSE